ncbi:MAG: exosortase/archaeosortase family protein [Candidatus Omnitrophica bacterium]|nr:exosortase/archaeosortase family protein [Candidatus Omnitrophota bacterium]
MSTVAFRNPKDYQHFVHYTAWVCLAALYSPVFFQLYKSRWETIDYTHAYFVLPVSLWTAWQRREKLKALFRETHLAGLDIVSLLAIVIGLFMFVFGWRLDYLAVSTFSLIPLLWGSIRFLYGSKVVEALTFPLLFLLFLIPPPIGVLDSITIPMRYTVSQLTESILSAFHYPITRNGLLLTMDGHDIFMGAPCSGFRSLITMITLAVAYVSLINANLPKKIILIISGIPFALLGNLIRVLSLCLVTHYFGQEKAEGFFHDFSGIMVFLIVIGCLMGLEFVVDRIQKRRSRAQ